MTKILFIADTHIGGEHRWGVSAEKWDAPFREAIRYAHDNEVSLIVLAGDTFEKRNPTTEEWKRFRDALIVYPGWVIDITGNHDVGAALESVSTTKIADTMLNHVLPADSLQMIELNEESPQIVCLPWPRPCDYGIDPKLDLETQIHETRAAVMARLHEICSALDPTRPTVLTGHAMISYGKFRATGEGIMFEIRPGHKVDVIDQTHNSVEWEEQPRDPGLLLGKDVVLPFDELCNLPNIKSNVLLGHVHDAGAKGYIGSPQPTDFADDGPKTFTVLEFDEGANDVSKWTEVNYQTSLKINELIFSHESELKLIDRLPHADIRRIKFTVSHDSTLSEQQVREKCADMQDTLIVQITRERLERARIDTALPVAQMSASAALAEWFAANEVDDDQVRRASDLFVGLGEGQ